MPPLKWLCLMLLALTVGAQRNAARSQPLIFTEVCVANIDQTIDYSNNYGSWVEIYNPTAVPIVLDGWYISNDAANLGKHRLEGGYGTLNPGCYGCIFFGHHASDGAFGEEAGKQVHFKLNRKGGMLYMSPNGTDMGISMAYPKSVARCSFALTALDGNEWSYCGEPTPGATRSVRNSPLSIVLLCQAFAIPTKFTK